MAAPAPLPSNVSFGTVTGRFIVAEQLDLSATDPDATPAKGTVTFTPSVASLRNVTATPKAVIVPKPIVVALDSNGALEARLIATDDPDLNPVDWTYTVSFAFTNVANPANFAIPVPVGSVQDLADLAPVAQARGTFYVVPPIATQALADSAASASSAATAASAASTAAAAASTSASAASASASSSAASAALVGAPAGDAIDARIASGLSPAVKKGDLLFNVRDYGAKGDGVTFDHAAIQSAINAAAAANGGTVFFPKGVYLLGAGISLASGVRLEGASRRAAVIKVVSPLSGPAVSIVGTSATSTIVQAGISHLAISGPGATAGGGSGIFIKWASVDVCLESLWVTSWGLHAVESVDSYSMSFVRCLFDANGGDGFNGTTNQNNLTFDRCIAILNKGNGYAITGGTTIKFLNCDSESNVAAGFDLRYVFAASLDTCHMEKNGSNGTSPNIYLHWRASAGEKSTSPSVKNCLIQGSGVTVDGIVLDGVSRAKIEDNWFSSHLGYHWRTTVQADRPWIGPNNFAGTGTEYQDLSASTVRMDYDYANLCARTDVVRRRPRATNPAVLAQGQTWWSSGTDQFKARGASNVRTVFTGYQATATLDFPSIAPGTVAQLTVTVTGVVSGDTAIVGPPANLPAGLICDGLVTAADTVTVRVFNGTAAAVDPSSAGWKVNVIRS